MNKITTDIITTTGINISKYDILPSKVFINGIEITDTGTWNEVISSMDVKDKEIDRLNNIINGLEKWLKGLIDNFNEDVSTSVLHEQMTINLVYDYLENLKELKENE